MMFQVEPTYHFVIYSLPNSADFSLVHQTDFGFSETPTTDGLNFCIRPFANGSQPIFIRGDVEQVISDLAALNFSLPKATAKQDVEESIYQNKVASVVREVTGKPEKVVLSRVSREPFEQLHVGKSLLQLRRKLPEAFIYLLHTPTLGIWMGATPEVLIERYEDDHHTMALAGTRVLNELFEQKEFEEQYLVAKDIVERLHDVPVEVGDVHEYNFGEIKHLRTLIQWKSDEATLSFAERLHPTPAVAGYPREKALKLIEALEEHDRELYTGYLGLIRGALSAQLFVNLRCMQLFEGCIDYYSGGGINGGSDPEKEWTETERKRATVMNTLSYE